MRRSVTLAAGIVIACAGAAAGTPADSTIKTTRLTDKVWLLSTDQGSYTTNTIAFVGDDGLLLVDTQDEGDAAALKSAVERFGKGLPKYIINTHRHIEHIGGNAIFGDDPVVIAHELVPAKLRSGHYLFSEFPRATFPDITTADSLSLYFNGERIRIIAMGGAHDDNEVIVHFTGSRVVHISSLVNGFNFPSVDSDGDVLQFAPVIRRAMSLLPRDVIIVSGHNRVGKWEDLGPYLEMLDGTRKVVEEGLRAGKDVETLQKEGVLDEWKQYAGSYVSLDDWIGYLARGLEGKKKPSQSVFEPVYRAWKDDGAEAAVARYHELKRDHGDDYLFREFDLLNIGITLSTRNLLPAAVVFLEGSLHEYPDSKYEYYTNYQLADAHDRLGHRKLAVEKCRASLKLKPDFEPAQELLKKLQE